MSDEMRDSGKSPFRLIIEYLRRNYNGDMALPTTIAWVIIL